MDIGVKEIRKWHKELGWLDIGYHLVIRRDGTLEPGRRIDVQGAHVEGYNHCSVGICMVGGVSEGAPGTDRAAHIVSHAENNFTPAQFRTLHIILKSLSGTYPGAVIQGHRDFPKVAKDCPSFDVRSWWGAILSTEVL